jgi:hypothetical protein
MMSRAVLTISRHQAIKYPVQLPWGDQDLRFWSFRRIDQLYCRYLCRHFDLHERPSQLSSQLNLILNPLLSSLNAYKAPTTPSNRMSGLWASHSSSSRLVVSLFRSLPTTTRIFLISRGHFHRVDPGLLVSLLHDRSRIQRRTGGKAKVSAYRDRA